MFEERLTAAARDVEQRLAALLAARQGEPIPERLRAAMRHAVLGGGKRFRPFLVLESAALFGGAREAALDVAAALECVHCYSLVHDDLPAMDNDHLRRGQPTVWRAFDDWTAILAGDALLTYAFEIIAESPALTDPLAKIELIRRLAADAGQAGMVGGQVIDLEADKLGVPALATVPHIERLQAMKTGALIRFAAEAGAVLAGAPVEHRAALATYGRHLGLAFQISDDLLDATGNATVIGKAVGKDAAAGKATLVSLLGLEAARTRLQTAVQAAISALAPFPGRNAVLVAAAQFMATRDR
ncbi:MAG: polyprenyl synthetase family protein [Hyphomicrobiaceae bacterium]